MVSGVLICLFGWYGPAVSVTAMCSSVFAQDGAKTAGENDADATAKTTLTPRDLRDGEMAISGRYSRFERMLSQMADILGRQDPERADLLRRAIGKGREEQIRENIEQVVSLLEKGELGTASEKQTQVISSLEVLLKLLQSEDRRSSVERERERLNELLKDVRNVLGEQKSARATTRNAEAPSSAAPGQQKAMNETDKLLGRMKDHDAGQAADEDTQEQSDQGESQSDPSEDLPKAGDSSKKSDDRKDRDGRPDGDDPDSRDSEKQSNGNAPDKAGQKGRPSSSAENSAKGKQSGSKSPPTTPGREQLERAREQMQQALEKLQEQSRDDALNHEDKAIEELLDAASKLEEMLKQLREEEKEMLLASLEARFQRMLIVESQIHEATLSLAATPQKDWLDQYYARCRELAQQQSQLAAECSQTANLLREDGTSVSILLAVEDIETDMMTVAGWMQESRVGDLTQSVQSDIISSLKQLIETTQKEMQEMKDQQKQDQQQSGQMQKPGLVELMAEIRMLRNLQLQVNRRTKHIDELLQSAPLDDRPTLMKQVQDLANRQKRLVDSARELAKQAK